MTDPSLLNTALGQCVEKRGRVNFAASLYQLFVVILEGVVYFMMNHCVSLYAILTFQDAKVYNNEAPGQKHDLHNLAGLHTRLNSRLGNKSFGEPAKFRQHQGCKISPLLFCPVVGRGEVARKCAYMASQYGVSVDLPRVISVDTMLEWNERYPPTDDEKRKNDLVYDLQGTYNQFVVDSSELNRVFNVK